jgi:hypothetical protein
VGVGGGERRLTDDEVEELSDLGLEGERLCRSGGHDCAGYFVEKVKRRRGEEERAERTKRLWKQMEFLLVLLHLALVPSASLLYSSRHSL